jgi:L-gulonolactone oxidase
MDVRLARTEPSIEMESIQVPDLAGFLRVSGESTGFPYTVGWIDGTAGRRAIGRGVFMRGRSVAGRLARPVTGRKSIPAVKPASALIDGRYLSTNWLLNPLFIRAFNSLLYRRQGGSKRRHVTFDRFFFPLDAIRNWNRMYGSRGFFQYQFVVPPDPDCRAVRSVLEAVASSSAGAFLGVIKEFGDQANGGLSFPIPGVTVALDFPNTGPKLLALLDRLDGVVADAGGRVYLSKDARLGRDAFRRMYPEWREWKSVRDRHDSQGVFQSELGKRLGLVGE